MKKLMFAIVAAASFAVMAAETEGPKAGPGEGFRRGPRERGPMAERGMMGRGGFGGEGIGDPSVMAVMNPRIAEKIGLSEEVRQKLRTLETDSRKALRDHQTKIRTASEKQSKLMKAEKIDEAAVMAAIDEVFEARKEMAKAQVKRVIAIKAIVTPEQLAKALEEMKAFRGERRRERIIEGTEGPKEAPKAAPAEASKEAPKDK